MLWLLILIALLLWIGYVIKALHGEDLRRYDQPQSELFWDRPASQAHAEQERLFTQLEPEIAALPKQQLLKAMRQRMDDWGTRVEISAKIQAEDQGPVAGEWLLPEGYDPDKRLLYIHGGAFTMGSPRSHRIIADNFARITGAAVFVVDYRLCPEYARLDGLNDCQESYRWLLEQGPDGPAKAKQLIVAGDSAGGNLCLSLLAWIRDQQLPQPSAAVALSPLTDATLSSASLRSNLRFDKMLKPLFRAVIKTPRWLLLPVSWLSNRVRPNDPRVSPIHGSLHDLPPLLIQASASECLADDASRYACKALQAGSAVELQLWANLMHVWHLFEPELDEAKQAFAEMERFLQRV